LYPSTDPVPDFLEIVKLDEEELVLVEEFKARFFDKYLVDKRGLAQPKGDVVKIAERLLLVIRFQYDSDASPFFNLLSNLEECFYIRMIGWEQIGRICADSTIELDHSWNGETPEQERDEKKESPPPEKLS
jgi:hypothetical protein